MDKDKKKTLTISSDLKKKIDTTSILTSGKKSFSVDKKKNHLELINHLIEPHLHQVTIQILKQRKKTLQESL